MTHSGIYAKILFSQKNYRDVRVAGNCTVRTYDTYVCTQQADSSSRQGLTAARTSLSRSHLNLLLLLTLIRDSCLYDTEEALLLVFIYSTVPV